MKNILYIFISIFILAGCEEVIDVDLTDGDPRLVVDASFQVFMNESVTPIIEGGVQLKQSTPFFDEENIPVNNAEVFITNLSNNSRINFIESSEPGFYIPDTEEFIPDFDISYQLTVIVNNETYVATAELIPTVPIDAIEQGDGTLFDGNETEVIVFFTDDGDRDDYYLFDFDFNLFLGSEDRFYQGESFNFSYFYEDGLDNRNVTIKILGIDENYYNYINLVIEQSEQDGGNPFQTPPATLKGNIINTTNKDNYALGYFNLSEANRSDITIVE
ncbi:DUF4249 family protein [Aquimarina pacifica]|uniref:DUF4249 family protein n=1 Tax=Aquimarina pacifica TaxID=1296415 RepID=UPI0004702319|nr:DUF4249 family protein [Aquimarina pacifica]